MSRHVSVAEVRNALSRRAFDEIIGAIEDELFEAKGAPYQFDRDLDRYELAKDVSAMANAVGGVIVFGFATDRNAAGEEEVSQVRLIRRDLINLQQHHDILARWTFPTLDGVEIEWFGSLD